MKKHSDNIQMNGLNIKKKKQFSMHRKYSIFLSPFSNSV